MRVVVIAGGVGGARFLRGLRERLRGSGAEILAVVNIADDAWMNGLLVSPDLDSIMYTLAGDNDEERGWGRRGETERISAELEAYGLGVPWFTLGDLDFATHIARSALLRDGLSLSEATERLCARWDLGVRLVPASNDPVTTRVHTRDGEDLHFQEWWVRTRAQAPVDRFEFRGAEAARPAPGILEAIAAADRVIVAPSNPIVSVGAVLAVPGIRAAIQRTKARVVGVSPIIGGRVVRGMADTCLTAAGIETSARAVGCHYGARTAGGLIDGWLVDTVDAGDVAALEAAGLAARAVPLWMRNAELSARIAGAALEL